jgi:hypothetical protein
MDFQPANLFVRGVDDFGYPWMLVDPLVVYRYLNRGLPTHAEQIRRAEEGLDLSFPARRFWTTWGEYSAVAAVRQLALPGGPPTHVLAVDLQAGVEILGPTWVAPLPFANAFSHHGLTRDGNGIELLNRDDLDSSMFGVVGVRDCRGDA